MTTPKTINRKTFMTSAVSACATLALTSCSDGAEDGGTGGKGAGDAGNGGTTGGTGGAGTGGAGTGGAGRGGAGTGGTMGGSTWMCVTSTNDGTHSHPLTIPSSDVERGFQETLYLLEDGGTGHTHTLELTPYDFLYLQGGVMHSVDSSEDEGHLHPCVITCTEE